MGAGALFLAPRCDPTCLVFEPGICINFVRYIARQLDFYLRLSLRISPEQSFTGGIYLYGFLTTDLSGSQPLSRFNTVGWPIFLIGMAVFPLSTAQY